jgi:hypothetical protein
MAHTTQNNTMKTPMMNEGRRRISRQFSRRASLRSLACWTPVTITSVLGRSVLMSVSPVGVGLAGSMVTLSPDEHAG